MKTVIFTLLMLFAVSSQANDMVVCGKFNDIRNIYQSIVENDDRVFIQLVMSDDCAIMRDLEYSVLDRIGDRYIKIRIWADKPVDGYALRELSGD